MKRKIMGIIGAAALALGMTSASVSAAPNPPGGGDCHSEQLHLFKEQAGTRSAEATADFFELTPKAGQEFINASCGKS